MKFKRSGENTVEIILNAEELSALELCPEEIDCDDPLTRRILARLLKKAVQETGLCFSEGEFLIEISKMQEEAVFTLTKVEDKNETERTQQVYRFGGSEEVIQSCLCLNRQFGGRLGKSSLYAWNQQYYLAVSPQKEDCAAVRGLLLEYGCKAQRDKLAVGVLAEHGSCLIEETAVETLNQYFS